METVICCVFFVLESCQIQTTKRKRLNTLIFERNYLKRLIFYRAYKKNEEHKYSRGFREKQSLESWLIRLLKKRSKRNPAALCTFPIEIKNKDHLKT